MNTKIIITLVAVTFAFTGNAQTNIFPSSGDAGIGTQSPTSELHIRKDQLAELRLDHASASWNFTKLNTEGAYSRLLGAYRTEIVTDFNENVTWYRGLRIGSNASMAEYSAASPNASFFSIALDVNSTPQYLFSITGSTGNVGIGTTTPDNKLDVKGKIRAEEVIVETGWSDFVFEESYRLRSLDEVQTHIEQHGHLPDVPPAAVVESEGLPVGEAQKIMMQKIEELTLYVIAQQKEIDELRSKLSQQEARYNSE